MDRILITGANRGIGLELVRLCAARGDRVFAGCRAPEQASALKGLSAKYLDQISLLPLEITDAESVSRCFEQVSAETDALDLLINNAAIFSAGETLRTFNAEKAAQQWTVNAIGQMLVAQKALDLLKAGTAPKIINICNHQIKGEHYELHKPDALGKFIGRQARER